MAGSRDDGTVAGDNGKHPNRQVHKRRFFNEPDPAPPQGIRRPNLDNVMDAWDPEDIAEQQYWQRARKNENLGYPENYDGSRGY